MEENHTLKYRILESTSEDPDNSLYELMKGKNNSSKDKFNYKLTKRLIKK